MNQYVVYENPSDYPGKFVVRHFVIGSGTITADNEPLSITDTLKAARSSIPDRESLVPILRAEDDDPVIVEVWL